MAPTDQLGVVGFGRDARLLAPLADPRLLGISATAPTRARLISRVR